MHGLLVNFFVSLLWTCMLMGQGEQELKGASLSTKELPTLVTTASFDGRQVPQIGTELPISSQDHKLQSKELDAVVTGAPAPTDGPQKAQVVQQDELSHKATQTDLNTEMPSIDTMDLDQPEGNWLNKRVWWERAKDKYRECREVFDATFAARMSFLEKRSEIEKTIFDPFYREIGYEQSELRQLLTRLIDYIEKERDEAGFLDEKTREQLEKITVAKKDLEQLKIDIDMVNDIDIHIDEAISRLTSKINEAHRFEQSAWQEFDAIAHELSDKKAHDRFYVIDNIHKNLKELHKYVLGEFSTYFNGIIQAAKEKTDRARADVQALSERGINLAEQEKLLLQEEQSEENEEARRAAQKAADEAKRAAQEAKVGLICKLWRGFVFGLKSLWNLIFGWWLYKFV